MTDMPTVDVDLRAISIHNPKQYNVFMNLTQRIQRTMLFLIALGAFGAGSLMLISGNPFLGIAFLLVGISCIVWMSRVVSESPAPTTQDISSSESNDQARPQFVNEHVDEDDNERATSEGDLQPLTQIKRHSSSHFVQISVKNIKPVPFWVALIGIAGGLVIGFLIGHNVPSNSQLVTQVTQGGSIASNQTVSSQQNQNQQNVQPSIGTQDKADTQAKIKLAKLTINGKSADVQYSEVDMGQIENIFDGKLDTLLRGKSANPYVVQANFLEAISASTVSVKISAMSNAKISLVIVKNDGSSVADSREWAEDKPEQTVNFALNGAPVNIKSLRIEILDRRTPPGEGFHTHMYEVALN